LLTVSSLVAAIFGARLGLLHDAPRYTTAAIAAALLFFAITVTLVVLVFAPREGWEFQQNLGSYFPDLLAGKLAPVDVTANLAEHTEESRKRNQVKLNRLYRLFRWACIFTGLQVIAWGLAVVL
jgi:hypothetical protein